MKSNLQIHLEDLSSNSQKAFTLQNSKQLGERKQSRVVYSPYEILYLVETKKAELIKNNKQIMITKIKKLLLKNKQSQLNYLVFKDLRKKGYIVKTGLKFGAEFRFYSSKKQKHATHLVVPIQHSSKIDLKEFTSINRVAHSTGKKLLLAIIDNQEDITYYEISWFKI